jgi:hypothetical protein
MKRRVLQAAVFLLLLAFTGSMFLLAQEGQEGHTYYLDAGLAVSGSSAEGAAFGVVLDPSIALTPTFYLGSKNILSYGTDGVISLETQAYFRMHFLHLKADWASTEDSPRYVKPFVQAGVGLYGALRGPDGQDSRSSLLFDATAGVTIPVNARWHIEPSVRVGYPFHWGVGITAGYKIPARTREVPAVTPMI